MLGAGLGAARAVEAVVAEALDPGAQFGLVGPPAGGDGIEVREVRDRQLSDRLVEGQRVRSVEPLAPAPLDVELVDEGRA